MKLGVQSNGLAALGWEKALAYCRQLGLDAIELAFGAFARRTLLDADALLADRGARQRLKDDLARHGLEVSALSCSGNAIHPDADTARRHEQRHDTVVHLAAELGVSVVCTFSGCPGGAPGERTPNWVTCAWPPEFRQILEYQWDQVLVPFWKRKAAEARDLGVRIALEAHPGFAVYNPETLLKLR